MIVPFILPVLFSSSIASYQNRQRIFCANNCFIAFGAGGAGAFIRHFGPESMGGAGDIGAKINADVARTEISADEIGTKVYLVSFLAGPK